MGATTHVYMRVSSDKQTTQLQQHALDEWVKHNPCSPKVITDVETGRKDDRKGFLDLLQRVRDGKVKQIIVWRLDRLGRSLKAWSDFMHTITKYNVPLISISESIDLNTSAGKMLATVMMACAVYESEAISSRTKAGLSASRAKGGRVNGNPVGSHWVSKKVAEKIPKVKKYQAAGMKCYEIAEVLKLHQATVKRIMNGTITKEMDRKTVSRQQKRESAKKNEI